MGHAPNVDLVGRTSLILRNIAKQQEARITDDGSQLLVTYDNFDLTRAGHIG